MSNGYASEKLANRTVPGEHLPAVFSAVAELSAETQVRVLAHGVFNERENAQLSQLRQWVVRKCFSMD